MVMDTMDSRRFKTKATLWYRVQLRWCAFVYVFGCFVRSVWPRIDVERICFFDSFLSVTLVGRTLACAAELCFAHQLGLVLKKVASDMQGVSEASSGACKIIYAIGSISVPLIAVAQTCCWMGVLTTPTLACF